MIRRCTTMHGDARRCTTDERIQGDHTIHVPILQHLRRTQPILWSTPIVLVHLLQRPRMLRKPNFLPKLLRPRRIHFGPAFKQTKTHVSRMYVVHATHDNEKQENDNRENGDQGLVLHAHQAPPTMPATRPSTTHHPQPHHNTVPSKQYTPDKRPTSPHTVTETTLEETVPESLGGH